jgi:hypothetical protein
VGAEEKIRFTSSILPKWARRTKSLDALLPVLYLRGVAAQLMFRGGAALEGPAILVEFRVLAGGHVSSRRRKTGKLTGLPRCPAKPSSFRCLRADMQTDTAKVLEAMQG